MEGRGAESVFFSRGSTNLQLILVQNIELFYYLFFYEFIENEWKEQ